MEKYKDPIVNSFTGIGASLAGIFLVIVIMFLIFAREQAELLVDIAWAFVVLGIVISYFSYQSLKNNVKKK